MPDEMRSEAPVERSAEIKIANDRRRSRIGGLVFAGCYLAFAFAAGSVLRPLDFRTLVGVALVPGVIALLVGVPHVVRAKPRGRFALMYAGLFLVVVPIAAVLTMGLCGALLAHQVAAWLGS